MTNEALDYLLGGAPTANFLEIGTVHEGRIRTYEKVQQRDMDTGSPKFWDDGSPMWQMVITIETDERDPDIDGDDGVRRLFVKAQMLQAVRDAIRKSGHRGEVRGGKLGVKYVRDDPPTRKGFNGPKVYVAKFEPPTETDEFEDVPAYVDGEEPF